jgi:hypothetical protein
MKLTKSYQERGVTSVRIDDMDMYWVIQSPEWTDFQQEPKPSVGSLRDDWQMLQRVLEDGVPTVVDFDRLAAMLRAVSAHLTRQP